MPDDTLEITVEAPDVETTATPLPEHNPDPRVRAIETTREAGEWILTPDGPVRVDGGKNG